MKIYNKSGNVIIDVDITDDSYRYSELCGDDYVSIEFYLSQLLNIPFESYILVGASSYTMYESPKIVKANSEYYQYTVRFEGLQSVLKKYRLYNTVDLRIKFTLSATAKEHIQMIADNVHLRVGETIYYTKSWRVGDCIDEGIKTISYDSVTCWEALNMVAAEFNTEFNVETKTKTEISASGAISVTDRYNCINLQRIEYNKDNPITLSYGKGNGFLGDVVRTQNDDEKAVGVMYIKGGSRNLVAADYGLPTLLFPQSKVGFQYFDGEYFEDEPLYSAARRNKFVVSDSRNSVRFENSNSDIEDVVNCEDIYPSKTYIVGNTTNTPDGKTQITVIITGSLDITAAPMQNISIVFQTGSLTGKEFKVRYAYPNILTIEPIYIDDYIMPGVNFPVRSGDKFIFIGINMPVEYVQDAEREALRRALKLLQKRMTPQYTYRGKIDDIWLKSSNNGTNIKCGAYINFVEFGTTTKLRIESVKEYINNMNRKEVTFGNKVERKRRFAVSTLLNQSELITLTNSYTNFKNQTEYKLG